MSNPLEIYDHFLIKNFKCPACKSDNIDYHNLLKFDNMFGEIAVGYFCKECAEEWVGLYNFIGKERVSIYDLQRHVRKNR